MDALLVYLTCPDQDIATKIAKEIIGRRHAACANILPPSKSFFRWEGAIQEAEEVTVIIKTGADKWPVLEQAIKEMHPYDIPCIIAVPVAAGHAPFLQWIGDEVSGGRE